MTTREANHENEGPIPAIRWRGTASLGERHRVEQAIRRGIERGVAAAGSGVYSSEAMTLLQPSTTATRYDPIRSIVTVPSYRDGGAPVEVPVKDLTAPAGGGEPAQGPSTVDDVRQLIQQEFPETAGAPASGMSYGLYVSLGEGRGPLVYFIHLDDQGRPTVLALSLWAEIAGTHQPLGLPPGLYTIAEGQHLAAELRDISRGTRTPLANPEGLDLRITFKVRAADRPAAPLQKPAHSLYVEMHVGRANQESQLATGSESEYFAALTLWGVDAHWKASRLSPLAMIGIPMVFHWEIRKVTKDRPVQLIRSERNYNGTLRHVWETEGDYRISCTLTVRDPRISSAPIKDEVRERVIPLEQKMAFLLAQYEQLEEMPDAKPIWTRGAIEFIRLYDAELAAERKKPHPNEARISLLEEAIAKMREQLFPAGQTMVGPFPIHAIFMEERTSQARPISLFLGTAQGVEPDQPYTWYLIDLTYPAFYKTYTGHGKNPHEALLNVFEDARDRFKSNYPPGYILASVSLDDLKRYGLEGLGYQPVDFIVRTYSWKQTAYEWLSVGVMVVGTGALAASFIFPPSAVIGYALLITAVAGAALSAINIAERIDTNSFAWDFETFADLTNIVAAIAQVGAFAMGARAAGIVQGIRSMEQLSAQSLSKLGTALKVQRALLLTGLGTTAVSALILGYDTYVQMQRIDASFDESSLADYERVYPADGRKRWENERFVRLLTLFARAALNGALLVVSARAGQQQMAESRVKLAEIGQIAQGRIAELGDPGELRLSTQELLTELGQRRQQLQQAGNEEAADALSRRMRRIYNWTKTENFLKNESAQLQDAVTSSEHLSGIAAEGGTPMLRQLWLKFSGPRRQPLKVDFEGYVKILQRHYRGYYGEIETAFRLGPTNTLLKAPDALVTVPGTDLIAIPHKGHTIYLIDGKALASSEVNAVSALTRNLPKNLWKDLGEYAKFANRPDLPAEFADAFGRIRLAAQEIDPLVKGLSKSQIEELPMQQKIDAILAKHDIKRVVTNAGGQVQSLSPDLEAMGLELMDINE